MLDFAQECHQYLEDVRFTVVSVIGTEAIEKSKKLADSLGIPLRVRQYQE